MGVMNCPSVLVISAAFLSFAAGCASNPRRATTEAIGEAASVNDSAEASSVELTLNALHTAAGRADASTYWALFAPDAVFLGTDANERWTLEEFKAYATPFFEKGQGWTYTPKQRHIAISNSGTTAWFDERLWNDKYGECRGSGVLVRVKESVLRDEGVGTSVRWKIAQYNLTVPIPNELLPEFAKRIRGLAPIEQTPPPPPGTIRE